MIDINTKTETFRVKIIKKGTNNKNVWVDYFLAALNFCSKTKMFNLCQTLAQSHYNNLDPFMREVMVAWSKVRPWFRIHAKTDERVATTTLP